MFICTVRMLHDVYDVTYVHIFYITETQADFIIHH